MPQRRARNNNLWAVEKLPIFKHCEKILISNRFESSSNVASFPWKFLPLMKWKNAITSRIAAQYATVTIAFTKVFQISWWIFKKGIL